jgi:hypothetical protein
MHPRKLQFVVGTGLLGVTLVGSGGCRQKFTNPGPTEPIEQVNPGPEPVAPIEGEGETPETPPPDEVETPEPAPEIMTNEGPQRSLP